MKLCVLFVLLLMIMVVNVDVLNVVIDIFVVYLLVF